MTIFNGTVRHNSDGTKTYINTDGKVIAHGNVVQVSGMPLPGYQQIRDLNMKSHRFGPDDDCIRCYECGVLVTNGWKKGCSA